jgi:hypothetical protein
MAEMAEQSQERPQSVETKISDSDDVPLTPGREPYPDVPARFVPFFERLESEVERRRAADAERVELVRQHVILVQEKLKEEEKIRKQVDDEILAKLTARIDDVYKSLLNRINAGIAELEKKLKAAEDRLTEAELALKKAREDSIRELAELKHEVHLRMDKIQEAVKLESFTRREEDAKLHKLMVLEVQQRKEQCEKEVIIRQEEIKALQERCLKLEHEEMKASERAMIQLFEELKDLRKDLAKEKEERKVADDKFKLIVQDVSATVQKGLKIVNKE